MIFWLSVFVGFTVVIATVLFPKMLNNGLFSHAIIKMHHVYYKSTLLHKALALFSTTQTKAPKGLPDVKKMEHISKNVTRVLGLNPGPHTLQGTNTYLVGSASSKILVDTGEGKTSTDYVSFLFDDVFSITQTKSLSHILLTHGHDDHQGGIRAIMAELKKRNMLPLPTVHKYQSPTGSFPVKNVPEVRGIDDGDVFETDGATLQALYSPGHTDDHVCFILKENHALLSGDCILGCGSAVFEDLHSYMTSLKRLRLVMKDGYCWREKNNIDSSSSTHSHSSPSTELLPITSIYPGHGPVLSHSVLEKVDEYIAHRDERECQILTYLQSSAAALSTTVSINSNPWRSSWEIMTAIYPSSLPLIIKVSAQHNVQHHLSKLVVDGSVVTKWPDLWCAVTSTGSPTPQAHVKSKDT